MTLTSYAKMFSIVLLASCTGVVAAEKAARIETVIPIRNDSFNKNGTCPERKQGGNPREVAGYLAFDGSMDGNRQVDPQIAVGGSHVLHGTNNGIIIYDKKGNFVQGVRQSCFNGGIDPKLFFDAHNRVFGFDLWNPWDKEKKKPVNISVSESADPTGAWNTYPVPAPGGRDGGGIGYSGKWIGYTFPGGREQTFVLKMAEAKAGAPATVYHFAGNLGHPVATQDDTEDLYFVKVSNTHFTVLRVTDGGNGSPEWTQVGSTAHGLEYIGFPPQSPQKDTDQLTASGDRNPKNLVLQGGHIWFSQTVNCNGRAAVQWHQIKLDGSIVQTGLISGLATSYIQTTLAVNKNEDMLVGFQETNADMYISPRLAFRLASDPPGQLREIVKLGEGQGATDGVAWGDYSGSVVDGDNLLDLWTIQSITDTGGKGDTIIVRVPFQDVTASEEARAIEAQNATAPSRPNILFLFTDDQRDNTFGAMGHPFVKTPNVDRLLSQSVRFRNTYTAEPVCSPSRVSLLTGMHERVHGVGFTSSYQLTEPQWDQTYPALLHEAGYYTGFVGKFGVEYYTFKGQAGEKFDFWWGHDGWTKFPPKDFNSPSTTPYHRADEDIITPIMGQAMSEFLDSLPGDKPFCLSVSFNVPHGSQTTSMYPDYPDWHRMTRPANENPKLQGTQFYDTLYRDIDIDIPDETGTDPYRFIPQAIMDQDKGRRTQTYPYDYTRPTCLEHHVRYYQTISGLDHVIGGLLEDLDERGLAENTVILYGSDHGLLMGEYGMGGKALLYDLASKIPCFVFDPKLPASRRGREDDSLVSSLDITRTILDYAGVEPAEFMQGESLRPLVEGKDIPWRTELFLESLYTGRDTPFQEGIRQGKWKYIRMYDAPGKYNDADVDFTHRKPDFEMLFDLDADPGEKNNLIESHADSTVLASLRSKCESRSQSLNQRRQDFVGAVEIAER